MSSEVLRAVLRQATKSLVQLQRQFHLKHTVKRAAITMSEDSNTFVHSEHLSYNDFQSQWKSSKKEDIMKTFVSDEMKTEPFTTSDKNRDLSQSEIQSLFYAEFLPNYMEDNSSALSDWAYEKGEPPPDHVFDDMITGFYNKYLPNKTMVSRLDAAHLLQFFPECYAEEFASIEISFDEEKDGINQEVYILDKMDEEGEDNEDEEADDDEERSGGCDLLDDSQLFNETWLMEQFELNQQSPANFVKSVMATEWQQLIEENYIAEPHIVQEHMFVGDTSKEEDQHHIIVQRNIEVGFSMLRKANRHVDYVESLRESGFFEPKTRLTTEEKERKKERKEKSGVAKVVSKSLKLQYCVGQSLVHRLFGNCVVTGWDKECEASDDWCKSNRIDQRLKHGRHQPFYNVLCEDGEYRYCSQENLTVRDAKDCLSPINHQAVGYFFKDYNVGTGLHVMNDDLRMRYLDDMELNDIAMISYHNKKKEVEEELGNMKKPMSEVDDNPDVRGSALEGVKDDDIKSEDSLHTAREAVTNFINLRKDR